MMSNLKHTRSPLLGGAMAVAVAAGLAFMLMGRPGHSAPTQAVTAPPPAGRQEATFAAGCFWSMEAIFKQLKGVDRKSSPATAAGPPRTRATSSGRKRDHGLRRVAGHRLTTPKSSPTAICSRCCSIARDPTSLNQPGSRCRARSTAASSSTADAAQKQTAEKAIAGSERLPRSGRAPSSPRSSPVFKGFYQAEDYHLNYYALHPDGRLLRGRDCSRRSPSFGPSSSRS